MKEMASKKQSNLSRISRQEIISQAYVLDPELQNHKECRLLVELGADTLVSVTEKYGTPQSPRWVSGPVYTDVIMSYHCGGIDGHSSVGNTGMGVPKNALSLASIINQSTYLYSPEMRAIAFYAASAHDCIQLHGRSVEFGHQAGDEFLSAKYAKEYFLNHSPDNETAELSYKSILATSYDSLTHSQSVIRKGETDKSILIQELVACSDLLGITSKRGALGSLEFIIEDLFIRSSKLPMELRTAISKIQNTHSSIDNLLLFIDQDISIKNQIIYSLDSQINFFETFKFADKKIYSLSGLRIDHIHNQRKENINKLFQFKKRLTHGESLYEIFIQERDLA